MPREQEGDHDGREHLKEAFHPKMDHPPAPIFRSDERAALPVHQARRIEERNRNARHEEQHQQVAIFVVLGERRFQAAPHQPQPEDQSAKEQDLPHAAKVDIFVALRAEPEPQVAQLLLDTKPLTRERTYDHGHQRDEQNIHAKALPPGLVSAHRGSDVQPGRQPRGRDPENADLQVPGARHGIRQPPGERNSIEAIPFDAVVRDDGTHRDLDQPQRRNYEEVLYRGAL